MFDDSVFSICTEYFSVCGFQTRKVTDIILIMYKNARKRLILAVKFGVSFYLSFALGIVMQAGEVTRSRRP
jgi:hypothetical protein